MRNHVQENIDCYADWTEQFERDFAIQIIADPERPHLLSLKYDQINSPMDHPLVVQCRGMIVDASKGKVLAWPYNKFWNLGEKRADAIDWGTACVQEKLDGSLMIVYELDGQWVAGSSGTPLGHGTFGDSKDETFGSAFWRVWNDLGYLYPTECEGLTLMFEFCAQPNRIVVRHDSPRIVLHGARHLLTGVEVDLGGLKELAARHGWEVVQSFSLASAEGAIAAAATLDPLAQEGFVVVDAKHHRVKIKSPRYVALHHLKGAASPRRAIELWQSGEWEELLTHFPEMGPDILPILERLDEFVKNAYADHVAYSHCVDRKQFAACVKVLPYQGVLFRHFGVQASEADLKASMRAQTTQSLERMLGL